MSNDNSKSKTLGAFLKSRRNRLQPEQAGLRLHRVSEEHRLRREEVAMLAGVSATYYTWLEQGREVTASKEIIESIGEALQLTHDERAHLIQLWNPNEAVAISPIHTRLNPQWQHIIDQLSYPSFISNEKAEVLAWNSAANEVITDFSSLSVSERVMIRLLFVDSNYVVEWLTGKNSRPIR